MPNKAAAPVGIYDGYRTVREIVQHRLMEDIQSGRIRPGERLREAELAERYGVSRGPVREAVRALEGQRLVSFRPNRGAILTLLSRVELEEIYDVVLALEKLALAPLARPIAAHDLAPLEKTCAQMARTRNPETWLAYNDEFHLQLYRLGGRLRVCRMIEDLLGALLPYAQIWAREDEGRLVHANAEHRQLLDSLAANDIRLLRNLTREHRLRAKRQIASALKDGEPRVGGAARGQSD
ncbi:MAG: GntR family transcriptional regulator [Chloroflexi bacterium]|nr:GntR family transcriptional regulator [Chloroflexota bacterium]